MAKLNPYLNFPGTCEQALQHYARAFGGEIQALQRFGDAPMESPPEAKNLVLHAQFRAGDVFFMASDAMPGQPTHSGTQVQMSVTPATAEEQDTIWSVLAEGGKVTMPLQDTFWGARFGMLIDRFGVPWMLNLDHAPSR